MVMLAEEELRGPDLFTVDGWQEWVVAEPAAPPERPSANTWRALGDDERWEFDLARIDWHSDFGLIRTPDVRRVQEAMRQQVLAHRRAPSGRPRPGSLIDGLPTLGKSTILQYFGRMVERELRTSAARRGRLPSVADRWVPVVHLTLYGDTSLKAFNQQMLRFYGHVPPAKHSKDQLTAIIAGLAHDCRTRLFLIDDIHFLKGRKRDEQEVNDHLKNLASLIDATFVFAGIDCSNSGFLDEGRSPTGRQKSQVRWRIVPHQVRRFAVDTDTQKEDWASLLHSIERRLMLMRAPERMGLRG